MNILEQIEVEQPLKDLREMERQLVVDKGSLPGLRSPRSAQDRAGKRRGKRLRFGQDLA